MESVFYDRLSLQNLHQDMENIIQIMYEILPSKLQKRGESVNFFTSFVFCMMDKLAYQIWAEYDIYLGSCNSFCDSYSASLSHPSD